MIGVIYYEEPVKVTSELLFKHLQSAYQETAVSLFNADEAVRAWRENHFPPDDFNLIVVVFSDNSRPCTDMLRPLIDSGLQWKDSNHCVPILPVSTNSNHLHPPEPLSGIKALPCFNASEDELSKIEKRVGALLGLNGTIFISYANSDGNAVARQLGACLKQTGFPWLDLEELKGGEDVQPAIEQTIKKEVALLVVLDSPAAEGRKNVLFEIECALGYLVPILPIVFRASKDENKGTRFPMLLDLQRWVEPTTSFDDGSEIPTLDETELRRVLDEIEKYLLQLHKWRVQLPHLSKDTFQSAGFDRIDTLDDRALMYSAEKKVDGDYLTRLLYHCALFNPTFREGLKAVLKYTDSRHYNYRLLIHGEVRISEMKLSYIMREHPELQAELRLVPIKELLPFLLKNF